MLSISDRLVFPVDNFEVEQASCFGQEIQLLKRKSNQPNQHGILESLGVKH